MARITRAEIIDEALNLLDETGLDGMSTRRLARRLGVESASLYWHFKDKSELLNEMSAAVLIRHHIPPLPERAEDWRDFILDNARSFRRALLAHRDGARLHAGTRPTAPEMEHLLAKVAYLVRAGFTEPEAGMALYATGQFTIGCVLEEQASASEVASQQDNQAEMQDVSAATTQSEVRVRPSATEAFEFGLRLLVHGLDSDLQHRS